MASRLGRLIALILLAICADAIASVLIDPPTGTLPTSQSAPTPEPTLNDTIAQLSAFDYSIRMNAARTLRRVAQDEVVPALAEAVRSHSDEFVRYRALILLTAFNDRGTADLMRALLPDRNDRIREVVYRWFEQHPDRTLMPQLLAALETEQAEFVRPALIRALAPLATDAQVQKAMLAEAGRGFDFFRSAVIQVLGEHQAAYAVDAIAPVAKLEGPLQDDAVLALGRIGDPRALETVLSLTNAPRDVVPAIHAAQCLLEDACVKQVAELTTAARGDVPAAARAALGALGVIASTGDAAATSALVGLGRGADSRLADEAAVTLSGAALRRPAHIIEWLERADEDVRTATIDLLRRGFERLDEDFAEEQFFASARTAYWGAAEGSIARSIAADLIDQLDF